MFVPGCFALPNHMALHADSLVHKLGKEHYKKGGHKITGTFTPICQMISGGEYDLDGVAKIMATRKADVICKRFAATNAYENEMRSYILPQPYMKKMFKSSDQVDTKAVDEFIRKAKEAGIERVKDEDPNDDLHFWDRICDFVYCDNDPKPMPQDDIGNDDVSEAGADSHAEPNNRVDWSESSPPL